MIKFANWLLDNLDLATIAGILFAIVLCVCLLITSFFAEGVYIYDCEVGFVITTFEHPLIPGLKTTSKEPMPRYLYERNCIENAE